MYLQLQEILPNFCLSSCIPGRRPDSESSRSPASQILNIEQTACSFKAGESIGNMASCFNIHPSFANVFFPEYDLDHHAKLQRLQTCRKYPMYIELSKEQHKR